MFDKSKESPYPDCAFKVRLVGEDGQETEVCSGRVPPNRGWLVASVARVEPRIGQDNCSDQFSERREGGNGRPLLTAS